MHSYLQRQRNTGTAAVIYVTTNEKKILDFFLQCTMYIIVQLSTKNMYVQEEAGWDNIELDIVKEKQINHR